jgi:hypothetical protein
MRPGGSLIVPNNSSSHQTGLSPKQLPKYKLDDLYQKQLIARHSS